MGVVRFRVFTATGGTASEGPPGGGLLEVTDLGAFGPKVLLLGPSAQNTPPGCICGKLDCRAVALIPSGP